MRTDGKVPDGWEVVHLGDVSSLRKKQIKPERGDSTPYVALENIDAGGSLNGYGEAGASVSNKTVFRTGDTLYGKLRPNLRKVIRAEFDGVCSTDILAVFAHTGVCSGYLSHLIRGESLHRHAMQGVAGTKMPRTSWSHLRRMRLALPPLSEQRAIAGVLDAIDAAIERTEAVIAATERLRDSLLHELLTRGVPGWHSEWKEVAGVGTVPACWEVVRLGEVATVRTGQIDPKEKDFQEYLFIGPDDIESETGRLINSRTVAEARVISGKYVFHKHDVLYCKIRPYLMKVYVPNEPGVCSADIYPLRSHPVLEPGYLALVLLSRSLTSYTRTCSDRTGIPKINRADLLKYRFALPPLTEQRTIARTLDAVDEAMESGRSERDRLNTMKAAAADALLTGRLRIATKGA